jgi:ribonuclease HII
MSLKPTFESGFKYEIGVDEVGRGPMFGRVYTAAVILPTENNFHHHMMKDSKKFTSTKKITLCSDYIKEYAIAYSIDYVEHNIIDKINIREATFECMHKSIRNIIKIIDCSLSEIFLIIDGNDFKPIIEYTNKFVDIPYVTVKSGDNIYSNIAAASILAKVARDNYINELCNKHPFLNTHYDIASNKGYGTKKHLNGIRNHGITRLHRKSFGLCKTSIINNENIIDL